MADVPGEPQPPAPAGATAPAIPAAPAVQPPVGRRGPSTQRAPQAGGARVEPARVARRSLAPQASDKGIGDRRFMDMPWREPSVEAAETRARNLLFEQGQAPFWGKLSSTDSLGPGIGLHFRLLWYFGCWFTVATCVAIPVFIAAFWGERLSTEEMDPVRLARISIANIGDRNDYLTNGSYTLHLPSVKATFSAQQISNAITAVDFIISCMFVGLMIWIAARVRAITTRIESQAISARDYTVFVEGLPPTVTEKQVQEHFESLYNLRKPDWTFKSSCRRCWCGRKTRQRLSYRDAGIPEAHPVLPIGTKADTSIYRFRNRAALLAKQRADEAAAAVAVEALSGRVLDATGKKARAAAVKAANTGTATPLAAKASEALAAAAADGTIEAEHLSTAGNHVLYDRVEKIQDQPGKPALPGNTRRTEDADIYPVYDAADPYCGSFVADVSLARKNRAFLHKVNGFGSLLARIHIARATAQKYGPKGQCSPTSIMLQECNPTGPTPNERRKQRALEALKVLETRLREISLAYEREDEADVVGAFVTFQNKESADRCRSDYQGSDRWWSPSSWCQADPLRFAGKNKLKVKRAPDPSQVLWQNLEVGWKQRACRQLGVGILMLVLMAASFAFIMAAQAFQSKFRASVPSLQLCDTLLPAVSYGLPVTDSGALAPGYTLPAGLQMQLSTTDATCNAKGMTRVYWTSTDTSATRASSPNATNTCLDECVSPHSESAVSCTTPSTTSGVSVTFEKYDVAMCWCIGQLKAKVSGNLFSGLRALYQENNGFCADPAQDYIAFNALVIVVSLVVVFINTGLSGALKSITAFEAHKDLDAMQRSTTFKVFLALFLNTACLVLLINAAMPAAISHITLHGVKIFDGKFSAMDVRWQTVVGTSIVLTMILNAFTVHLSSMTFIATRSCFRSCRRCCCPLAGVSTQQQLDLRVAPPTFAYNQRTAAILNTLFSCFFYSAGHPMLYGVAAFSFFLSLAFDRWTLLRIYRRPPRYDAAMGQYILSALPWALFIHMLTSIWMFSDPTVLYSERYIGNTEIDAVASTAVDVQDTIGGFTSGSGNLVTSGQMRQRLSRRNTIPVFLLWCLFCIVWAFSSTLGRALVSFVQTVLCCGRFDHCLNMLCCQGERAPILTNPPYNGPYAARIEPGKLHRLSDQEVVNGVRFWRNPANGQWLRVVLWSRDDDPVARGLGKEPHSKGERLLTWEVIQRFAIPDYQISSNPVYQPAVRMLALAKRAAEKKTGVAATAADIFHGRQRRKGPDGVPGTTGPAAAAATATAPAGGPPPPSAIRAAGRSRGRGLQAMASAARLGTLGVPGAMASRRHLVASAASTAPGATAAAAAAAASAGAAPLSFMPASMPVDIVGATGGAAAAAAAAAAGVSASGAAAAVVPTPPPHVSVASGELPSIPEPLTTSSTPGTPTSASVQRRRLGHHRPTASTGSEASDGGDPINEYAAAAMNEHGAYTPDSADGDSSYYLSNADPYSYASTVYDHLSSGMKDDAVYYGMDPYAAGAMIGLNDHHAHHAAGAGAAGGLDDNESGDNYKWFNMSDDLDPEVALSIVMGTGSAPGHHDAAATKAKLGFAKPVNASPLARARLEQRGGGAAGGSGGSGGAAGGPPAVYDPTGLDRDHDDDDDVASGAVSTDASAGAVATASSSSSVGDPRTAITVGDPPRPISAGSGASPLALATVNNDLHAHHHAHAGSGGGGGGMRRNDKIAPMPLASPGSGGDLTTVTTTGAVAAAASPTRLTPAPPQSDLAATYQMQQRRRSGVGLVISEAVANALATEDLSSAQHRPSITMPNPMHSTSGSGGSGGGGGGGGGGGTASTSTSSPSTATATSPGSTGGGATSPRGTGTGTTAAPPLSPGAIPGSAALSPASSRGSMGSAAAGGSSRAVFASSVPAVHGHGRRSGTASGAASPAHARRPSQVTAAAAAAATEEV